MLDFLEKRMQKSLAKMAKKTTLNEEDIQEVTREVKMALLEADVNLRVVKEFVNNVKAKALEEGRIIGRLNPSQSMIKIFRDELINVLGKETKEVKIEKKPYIVMMCGLQGSGKTTATAKLAYYLRKKKHISNPLVVAADIYRPAAVDQLVTLAKGIQVDYFEQGVNVPAEEIVQNALKQAQENKNDLIIIDTAGRLAIDEKLMDELANIKKIAHPDEIFFVADALSGQDIINVASTFHEKLKLTGVIITKLDSDARGGAALSLRQVLNIPIRFIGTGEKTSNLELFHPQRMAERILGMGDVMTLIEHASENIDEDKAKNMVERIFSGNFTLDDLMEQIKQMKQLGKFSKILKMLPGNIAGKIDEAEIEKAEEKMQLYQILMSSMTKKERKNPKLLKQASRKERILKGSGRSAQEYNKLLNEFEMMSKKMTEMANNFKKTGGFGGFGGMGGLF
ncbi:signal recognition particle protein [Mycoplasmopsis verecunda]|uniref:Signal recognition particle protein n=1 Tax=Mycoplasmopsis verecunda TaxID=171291 RepID=A0A1T4LRP3_9BACT|nr:signal recognition particle protein [Mycoplasmopsis verecunda]WPB54586.1 signal recognition particle protein [Mycoplasmopsis verecunda]SJZ57286.1 signal recognition particle subunit FFH/SRP54 (srp54) [Mycoplasmopsis verecunda]